ncbi:MAG: DUF5054 domain-containing protein [Tannerella sp.]|jgi:hypothetical protein|nr:DUF5054 domain-containing protein [Tannerella sp.]
MKRHLLFTFLFLIGIAVAGCVRQPNRQVEKVHVIFKTHLDIGFTDLSSKVEQRYIDEFIPKAIAVAGQLRAEGSSDRYIWTTGSWLVSAYLAQAPADAVKKLEEAIENGDIVWNGVPYTFESEAANRPLFENALKLSRRLDERFGKKTIAAKMTDVPGHTRSIVSPLYDAGIRFLHIGVNPASAVPDVPPVCLWRNTDGKEIVLMYQGDYGSDMILPDGKTVVSINFTSDNHGPHTLDEVKAIYAALRKRYPHAEIAASTLNAVAEEVSGMTLQLPVITSEIGDTWIHGYGSAPVMMARFRALSRLYDEWLQTGKLDKDSDTAIDYAVRLGMVAEHTWGLDIKTFLKNWDKYDVDAFNASRDLPEFRLVEASWKEKADHIDNAIALLPENLQTEARTAIDGIGTVSPKEITAHNTAGEINDVGAIVRLFDEISLVAGEIAYQTFSAEDYATFHKAYLRYTGWWALGDFGKPELENSKAQSAVIVARMDNVAVGKQGNDTRIDCLFSFADDARIDKSVLPEQINTQYILSEQDNSMEMTVSIVNKPANRLPEAYWVSFVPSQVTSILAEKTGYEVDVLDVVKGGNRQMHAIDNYVDLITTKGVIRITSLDAPLIAVGERNALNYSTELPDPSKGIHFCLFNNLWGTNFAMWWGGGISYRFKIAYKSII